MYKNKIEKEAINIKERDRHIRMLRKKGRKYNKGSIFYKPTKTCDLLFEAIKRTVHSVFAKKLTHKLKNVWKRKPEFVAEKKRTKLKHKNYGN